MWRWSILALAVLSSPLAPHAQESPSGLRAAAGRGDAAAAQRAIAARVPLDDKDERGQTALLLAVAGGHTGAAKVLIDAGASINAVAANKDTPWMLAGALGRAEILELMLPKAPDLSLRNRFGGNALIPACERGHVEAAEVLLRLARASGADGAPARLNLDHVNNLGWTCLLEIVVLGNGSARHAKVAELVLAAGADPNIADRDGVSPLTHARRRGFAEIARMIAAKGGR